MKYIKYKFVPSADVERDLSTIQNFLEDVVSKKVDRRLLEMLFIVLYDDILENLNNPVQGGVTGNVD